MVPDAQLKWAEFCVTLCDELHPDKVKLTIPQILKLELTLGPRSKFDIPMEIFIF